jgi:hypothetical protein
LTNRRASTAALALISRQMRRRCVEWVMFYRIGSAACAAAVAVMLLAPAPLNARGGAGVGHGGFRPVMHPVPRIHFPRVHEPHHFPLVHEPRHFPLVHKHRTPFTHRFAHRHPFHEIARRHHRGIYGGLPSYGYPLTYGDNYVFYGSYYDPSDGTASDDPPVYAVPPAAVLSVAGAPQAYIERGGCRSESIAMPSPGGADNSVIITRC